MVRIDLSGKQVLVTGASSGIGNGIASYLLRNGARVAVHYNNDALAVEALVQNHGSNAVPFQADFSQTNAILPFFESVEDRFGNLDAIIANAGVFLPHAINDLIDQWWSVWKRTLDVNLNAVGLLTKLGIIHFKKQKGGRFIYIGSRAAFRGETGDYLAYAASKGGLTSLARSVARSFGKDNIKSFVVAPGFVRTPMAEDFITRYGEERVLGELALKELTTPQDIAPLVGLLCSGGMDHATGTTIDVNAGSHIR